MKKIIITGGSKGIGEAIKNKLEHKYEPGFGGHSENAYTVEDYSRTTGYDLTKEIPSFNCDILILCAGAWDNAFELNYEVNKRILNNVYKKTHIIIISSNAAFQNYGNDDYTTAKAGIRLKAEKMQREGYRITFINPGTVNTDFWKDADVDNRKKCIPIEPREIAAAVELAINCDSSVERIDIKPRCL